MIKYRLVCGRDHEFEGWFGSAAAFDEQSGAGRIACPVCGSADVTKALMAPALATRDPRRPDRPMEPASPHAYLPTPVAEAVRRLKAEIEKEAEYVGPRFAEEARRIHYDETPPRGIYGEATSEEVGELDAEGIRVFPIPTLPEDHN